MKNLVDELQNISDNVLFDGVKETHWVSKGISKKERKRITKRVLKESKDKIK